MSRVKLDTISLHLLVYAVLLLIHLSEGLSCFECSSKNDHGCSNNELKAGKTKARFSKKCEGDAVCVKVAVSVMGYYQTVFSGNELNQYQKSLQKYSSCLGYGKPETNATTVSETITEATSPAGNMTGGASNDSLPTTSAGDETTRPPSAALPDHRLDDNNIHSVDKYFGLSPDGGMKRCPQPIAFPERTGVVKKYEHRDFYHCGSRSQWKKDGVVDRCRKTSDGVVLQYFCTCSSDLCNAATRPALSTAFTLLIAALLHLRPAIG